MTTIKEQFSSVFIYDLFGVVTGTVGISQMLDLDCNMARFKAFEANTETIFLGHESGTINLPWPMGAGDDTGWFATTNLNRYYYNAVSGSSDFFAYWIQR